MLVERERQFHESARKKMEKLRKEEERIESLRRNSLRSNQVPGPILRKKEEEKEKEQGEEEEEEVEFVLVFEEKKDAKEPKSAFYKEGDRKNDILNLIMKYLMEELIVTSHTPYAIGVLLEFIMDFEENIYSRDEIKEVMIGVALYDDFTLIQNEGVEDIEEALLILKARQ
jgi:hypothetical protein